MIIIAACPTRRSPLNICVLIFPEWWRSNALSLTVEEGDVCGLIGPNGAGKTTTMRAVSGLQECTRGTVKVDGHELISLGAHYFLYTVLYTVPTLRATRPCAPFQILKLLYRERGSVLALMRRRHQNDRPRFDQPKCLGKRKFVHIFYAALSRASTLGIQSLIGIFWGQRSSHSWQATQALVRAASVIKI